MADNDILDEILSDPTPDVSEPVADTGADPAIETPTTDAQPRAADGKFAPKAEEPDQTARAAVEGAEPTADRPQGTVPQQALHAEREKARTERERADNLERQLAEIRGQVSVLTQQRQTPQPAAEAAKPVDFWDNPQEFVQGALSPFQQQLQQQNHRFSRMMAVQTHGQEKVASAYQAMASALEADPRAQHDYQRIMASEHPYDELVSWHKRSETMQRVGSDPDAWFQAEYERRLSDPAEQAKIIERIRTGAAATTVQPGHQAPVSLPPSLNRIPGSGNAAPDSDVSSEGLFNHALAGR